MTGVVNHRETMYINSELLVSLLYRASNARRPGVLCSV
jgi:hypothetical protein